MRYFVMFFLLTATATAAVAQAEDAAHHADRLYTQELNRRAEAATDRRDRGQGRAHVDYANENYRAARARYEREMDDWRHQVAACRAGDYDACDH